MSLFKEPSALCQLRFCSYHWHGPVILQMASVASVFGQLFLSFTYIAPYIYIIYNISTVFVQCRKSNSAYSIFPRRAFAQRIRSMPSKSNSQLHKTRADTRETLTIYNFNAVTTITPDCTAFRIYVYKYIYIYGLCRIISLLECVCI